MKSNHGCFIISLDFELFWGVRDKKSIESYGENIIGVWKVIPALLEAFEYYKVNATFATVGLLFGKSPEEINKYLPLNKPNYTDANLSPYKELDNLKSNYDYFLALELIEKISNKGNHEIASHTFSHYYCLEPEQTYDEFRADIQSYIHLTKKHIIQTHSLVFPRNQINQEYLEILKEFEITSYRGNEAAWFYKPTAKADQNKLIRFFRLIDTYINLSGYNDYDFKQINQGKPYNIPSSRFLRPYNKKWAALDQLRLKRICNSMTHAAKFGKVYHLWWHPHNFGSDLENNMKFLNKILQHYQMLNTKYQFQSYTMKTLSDELDRKQY